MITQEMIKEKVREIALAEYDGDIKGFITVMIDKNDQLRLIESYDGLTQVNIYVGLGIAQRRIENTVLQGAKEVKPKE